MQVRSQTGAGDDAAWSLRFACEGVTTGMWQMPEDHRLLIRARIGPGQARGGFAPRALSAQAVLPPANRVFVRNDQCDARNPLI